MTDPDFLTKLHARFEAPRPVVVDLIERETHGSVHELRRLTLGDENEVYQARLSDGSAVYARIRRPGEDTFGPEIWAMERAGSAGVPIPHVLAVDEIVTEGGPRSIMLIAESPGRQLAELLPVLRGPQRYCALTNVGRCSLSSIPSLPQVSAGPTPTAAGPMSTRHDKPSSTSARTKDPTWSQRA